MDGVITEPTVTPEPTPVESTPEPKGIAPESIPLADPKEPTEPKTVDPKEPADTVEGGDSKPEPSYKVVKVNGKEMKVATKDIDKLIQMGLSADEKFKKAAEIAKQKSPAVDLKENTLEALKAAGIDPIKWSEDLLLKKMQDDKRSPEQVAIDERDAEIARFKEAEEARIKAEEDKKLFEAKKEYTKKLSVEIPPVLDSLGLPKTADVVKQIAAKMLDGRRANMNISFEEAGILVKQSYMSNIQEFLRSVENPLEWVGQDFADKVRKQDLDQLKGIKPDNVDASPPKKRSESKKKHLTPQEFKKAMFSS